MFNLHRAAWLVIVCLLLTASAGRADMRCQILVRNGSAYPGHKTSSHSFATCQGDDVTLRPGDRIYQGDSDCTIWRHYNVLLRADQIQRKLADELKHAALLYVVPLPSSNAQGRRTELSHRR